MRTISVIAIGLICFGGLIAQGNNNGTSVSDRYIVSATAGGVNYTEGSVTVVRENGTSGRLLKRDRVEVGDRISTESDGRAEILLNPGSYIRVGGNTTFEFGTTDLEDLQIRLDRGSAVFEVFASDEFRVSVFTPKGKTVLMETGVYRVDVTRGGSATVAVTEGKAQVGHSSRTVVKAGRMGLVGTEQASIKKFDRGDRDELAEWSKSRSKELAKMTSSLKNDRVRSLLIDAFSTWNFLDYSFGLWVYSPFTNSYCFLPYGRGWYSPYGYNYRTGLDWYRLPPIRSSNPGYVGNTPNNTPNPSKTMDRSRGDIQKPPPYVKMGGDRDKPAKWDGSGFPAENPGRSSNPTISAPPPMQRSIEPVSAPASTHKVKPIDN